MNLYDVMKPLSGAEWSRLAEVLDQPGGPSIDVVCGLLHALATAPSAPPPIEWIPIVMGDRDLGSELPLVLRLYNTAIAFLTKGEALVPETDDALGIENWCAGYMIGVALDAMWLQDDAAMAAILPVAVLSGDIPLEEMLEDGAVDERGEAWLARTRADLQGTVVRAYEKLATARRAFARSGSTEPIRRGPKVGRNDPCPCGSGKKHKKCCGGARETRAPYTREERRSAREKLDAYIEEAWGEEEEIAFDTIWGRFAEREGDLPRDFLAMSNEVHDAWFAFDLRLEDGRRVIDHLFEEEPLLTPGERAHLSAMRDATMRLYEVTDLVPGTSITLRDVIEGGVVTVNEKSASRSVARHQHLATRVVSRGSSGGPELDGGVLHVPSHYRETAIESLQRARATFFEEHPRAKVDHFYEEAPRFFHEVWLMSIFEPVLPDLRNTDDEEIVLTRVSFHVEDAPGLERRLDAAGSDGIERAGGARWSWSRAKDDGNQISLGTLALRNEVLTVEVNSVQRGAEARALVERLAGSMIRHRATAHEDVQRLLTERYTARALGGDEPDALESGTTLEIDPEVAEALALQYYATHYRGWIDEPVPALDGHTPREAAKRSALRPHVEGLLHRLETQYELALKDGVPAYDASWMWAELELDRGEDASSPPPLAHERVLERWPALAEACRATAERLRASQSFSDATTTATIDELSSDLGLQRFVREGEGDGERLAAAQYMPLLVNFELHRRKAFWVDEALAYMLDHTDVDVAGGELRGPFPSFAIVLTDRHSLSQGERLLSRAESDPLRGQILRVITAYVTERGSEEERVLSVDFAFDALGDDLPSLVHHDVPASSDDAVRDFLGSFAPMPVADPPIADTHPARALLRITINAILYATSAGVTPETRAPRAPSRRPKSASPMSSESVFFLPGKIDIRSVRKMQELGRAPDGRAPLARFMVRGHWRRPQERWKDHRLRWIEPYWKGPDLAAVIERAYQLKPDKPVA